MNFKKLKKIVSEDACYMLAADVYVAYYEATPYLVANGRRHYGTTKEVVQTAVDTDGLTRLILGRCNAILKRTPLEEYGIKESCNDDELVHGIKLSWGSRSVHINWTFKSQKAAA